MVANKKWWSVALAVLATAGADQARAQGFGILPNQQVGSNPNFIANPGLAQAQYMYNLQAVQQAQAAMYMQAANVNPLLNPYSGSSYNPTGMPSHGGGYTPSGSSSSYYPPYYPSYPYDLYPYSGYLTGNADILRAAGKFMTDQEQARILHQAAKQAKLDTERKRFDLQRYIRENTPTFTEEQAKIAKEALQRVQIISNPYEIWSGSSLNTLMKDLRKSQGKRVSLEPIPVAESVLRHLNVTGGRGGNLGLFRDDGNIAKKWPVALLEFVSAEKQNEINGNVKTLVFNARNKKAEPQVLRDLLADVDRIREDLRQKVNDVPTDQYREAKRFLRDFDDALIAVRDGDVVPYFEFQKFVSSGRTAQEVADYLIKTGLNFAAATQGDEAAYQAMHSALAAYDVALNAQLAAVGKE